MHTVGTKAHTAHGIGEIVEVDPGMRGGASYRVAGRGFAVWIDEAKLHVANAPERGYLAGLENTIDPGRPYEVNKDNSTTLPYDYTPQHHVDMFQGEQTIQPGDYEIDPDERLHSSDSLTGEQRKDNRPYPGPNPDLFAKSAGLFDGPDDGPGPEHDPHYEQHSHDFAHEREQDELAAEHGGFPHHGAIDWGNLTPEQHESLIDAPLRNWEPRHQDVNNPPGSPGADKVFNNDAAAIKNKYHHGAFEETDPERPEWGDDEWHEGLPDGPERTFDARVAAPRRKIHLDHGEPGKLPGWGKSDTPSYENDHLDRAGDWDEDEDGHSFLHDASYRPAGLSNRYAHIMEAEDHTEIGMFRRDPVGYQQRLAHVMIAGEEESLIQKFADYTNLLDSDEHMRTAAWKDVAAKAKRLRAEGAVHPKDIGPNRIMAMVDGDGAQYQTLVLRGPGYAGIGKGANSATFSCTCQWGKWAFKRQFTFVGRMCSHALATLWELQSHSSKGNKGKFKSAGITEDFKKWAEDNNDGKFDQASVEDFINTGEAEDLTKDDVEKLYEYVANNHQEAPERDYDIPYTFDTDKAYKTSDILNTRPQSLTPDLREVPKNDEHEWTDVTEDDRETTGPDQIVRFQASITANLHKEAGGLGDLWGDVKDIGNNSWNNFRDEASLPFDVGNTVADAVSAPVKGISNFIDRHNVQAHPDLVKDSPAPAGPKPATDAAANPVSGTDGGSGAAQPPPAKPAPPASPLGGPAGNPAAPPPGGPAAPGNPAPPAPGGGAAHPDAPGTNSIGQGSTYHVNQGDTLSDIAERAGLGRNNYQQIADANKIADPNKIQTGQDIKIPGVSTPTSAAGGTSPVQPGSPADPTSTDAGDAGGTLHPGGPDTTKPADASTPPGTVNTPGGNTFPSPNNTGKTGFPGPSPGDGPPHPPMSPPGGPPVVQDPAKNNPGLTNPALTPPPPGGTEHAGSRQRRYAESSDAALLDKLRQKSIEPASDDLHHMDARNDEIRDLVDELNDRGMDASFMVASLHYAETPADGNPDFLGQSSPGWADEPFQGSGPDPRSYISDSQSYLDDHEPDLHDVTDGDDIIKFNDSRSKPEQGPRHANVGDGVRSIGGGPRRSPRIDPGVRGRRSELQHSAGTMPENTDTNSITGLEPEDPLATPDMAIEASYDGGGDPDYGLVGNFQRSAAAQDLMGAGNSYSGGGGMFSDDAIAANAQAMLRTAGRKFTQAEQRQLEEEAHILGARNMPNEDDLAGTHYLMGM